MAREPAEGIMQVREGTNPDSCLKGSLMAVVPKDLEEPSLSQTGIGKVLAKEQGWKSLAGSGHHLQHTAGSPKTCTGQVTK